MDGNNAPEKTKSRNLMPVMVLVTAVLAIGLIYLIVRPYLNTQQQKENMTDNTDISFEDEPIEDMENETTPVNTPVETPEPTKAVTDNESTEPVKEDYKDDIDKDMTSLDSLDLSTAESDFGDGNLSDL